MTKQTFVINKLRAYQKRVALFAITVLVAVLMLFSVSFGQNKKTLEAWKVKTTRTVSQETVLQGTILDVNGAVVPNVDILLFKNKIKLTAIKSDGNGHYEFPSLVPGIYLLKVIASGFKTYIIKNIKINSNERSDIEIILEVSQDNGVIDYDLDDYMNVTVDIGSTSMQTTITKGMMNKLPH